MSRTHMKKRKPFAALNLLIIAVFFIAAIIFILYQNYYRTSWQPADLTETKEELYNPGRGWYQIYGYSLSDKDNYTPENIREGYKHDMESRLAMLQINLNNYRSSPISKTALQQLDLILSTWEQSGKQLILRFLYDWDGSAITTEPNEIGIIVNHMTQISSIINRYAKAIYTLQGIFVGNYGEMNSSSHMSAESMEILINHLAEVTDPSIYLSVRTPAHWREIASSYEPLQEAQAFSGTLIPRIGLFNDGMLGSESDCGTYGDVSLAKASSYSDKGLRAEELLFQNQLCRYAPNGGEVIIDNPYNDLDAAIADLYQMHVSYLNSMYDPSVLDKWKASTYRGNDIFNGCSGYEFISKHLGYRYILASTDFHFRTFFDKNASLTVNIKNIGFANCYEMYNVSINLVNTDTNAIQEIIIPTDTRTWLSGEITQLTVPVNIRSYDNNKYMLYLTLKDADLRQLRFANTGYDPSLGYYIGSLLVDKNFTLK